MYEVLMSEVAMATISFNKEWKQAVSSINKNIDTTIKQATKQLFIDIVYSTPVLTGYLRGNWQTSFGSPEINPIYRIDKGGTKAVSEIVSVIDSAKSSTDIYFTNNAPYAERIEFEGYSKLKAPAGMVRINTIRWPDIVNKFAQKNKDK